MAKIYAMNKQYNGVSAGIKFTNGEAECADSFVLAWFKKHGYEVVENQEPLQKVKDESEAVKPKQGRKKAE